VAAGRASSQIAPQSPALAGTSKGVSDIKFVLRFTWSLCHSICSVWDLLPFWFWYCVTIIKYYLFKMCCFLKLTCRDLILMAESEESLLDNIVKWKSGLEAKGLKMNTGKKRS